MTDTLITNVQQGIIDEVSDAALDVIIQDYLNNPNNGFMDQETVTTIVTDATCTIVTIGFDSTTGDPIEDCVYLDSTSITHIDTTALISVLEWKQTYLEGVKGDAWRTVGQLVITDGNSPNYPLVEFKDILYDFDTTSALDYEITGDATSAQTLYVGDNPGNDSTGTYSGYISDGAGADTIVSNASYLLIGHDTGLGFTTRSLLRFDLDNLPVINEGIDVISAKLWVKRDAYTTSAANLNIYKMLKSNDVGEMSGTATEGLCSWNNQIVGATAPEDIPWSVAGTGADDRETTPTDSVVVTGPNTWMSFEVTVDVRHMVDSTANYGWILTTDDEVSDTDLGILSELAAAGSRPYLELEVYNAPDMGSTYIKFEFPNSSKIEGVIYQPGITGCQDYNGLTNHIFLGFYIGYSENGIDWSYIADANSGIYDATANVELVPDFTDDQIEAESNPFMYSGSCPLPTENIQEIFFGQTVEAKYWCIYFVDIYETLEQYGQGWEVGYSGYTASIADLRFNQVQEHGKLVVVESLPASSIDGDLTYAQNTSDSISLIAQDVWGNLGAPLCIIPKSFNETKILVNARIELTAACQIRIVARHSTSGSIIATLDDFTASAAGIYTMQGAWIVDREYSEILHYSDKSRVHFEGKYPAGGDQTPYIVSTFWVSYK